MRLPFAKADTAIASLRKKIFPEVPRHAKMVTETQLQPSFDVRNWKSIEPKGL